MFQVIARSDRRKKPELVNVEYLTMDEIKSINGGEHINLLDQSGKLAQVKITSVKTWKRKPDIEINCKFGLYEYFTIHVDSSGVPDMPLVKIIYDDEKEG